MEHLKMRLNQLLEKKIELDNYLAKQLPKSILQEAIQGKLVPQIAEEGTAQELLDQIKAEKQKRVKDGKLKKSALNGSVIFRGDDNKYYMNNYFSVNVVNPIMVPSLQHGSPISSHRFSNVSPVSLIPNLLELINKFGISSSLRL